MGTTGGYWRSSQWQIHYYKKYETSDKHIYFPNQTIYEILAGEVDDYPYSFDSFIYLPEDVYKKCVKGEYTFKKLSYGAFCDWEIRDNDGALVCAHYEGSIK